MLATLRTANAFQEGLRMSIEESVRAVRAPEGSGVRRIGIAMNGVTGRMGMNQHLIRSILAIRAQGGVEVGREVIWPEPMLLGRDERKLARLAAEHGVERWSTDLDATLADPSIDVYFDAQLTQVRPDAVRKAIAAGKDVYCEKPVTETLEEGLEPARLAPDAGVKNAVGQDKPFLPGPVEIEDGPIVQMNSSWCVRVDRDELFELQVDGTAGSAVAGLRECRIQPAAATPMPVWNPDIPSPIDHRALWQRVPDRTAHDNGFKLQGEQFLKHVVSDEPFPWDFLEAAKGIQLAELGIESWRERRFVEVPEL